jgi:hypothetical protein
MEPAAQNVPIPDRRRELARNGQINTTLIATVRFAMQEMRGSPNCARCSRFSLGQKPSIGDAGVIERLISDAAADFLDRRSSC